MRDPALYKFKTDPFAHQRRIFLATAGQRGHAAYWEQGTGKTKFTVDTVAHLHQSREVDGLLVLAPGGVHRAWVTDELPAHSPVEHRAHFWRTQSAGARWHRDAVESLLGRGDRLAVLSMSYDSLCTKAGHDAALAFLKAHRCVLAADEATRVKNPTAIRTRRVHSLTPHAAYIRPLTGTPVAQGPFDLYSQLLLIDRGFWKRSGLGSYFAFKQYFGVWEKKYNKSQGREYSQLISYRNLAELHQLIQPVSSRVTKAEALDLPPKLYKRVYVELSPEQRRVYQQLRDEFVSELNGGGLVTAPLAITRLLRLQQVLSGYVPALDEEGVSLQSLGPVNPRMDALAETVGDSLEAGSKCIVWARFRRDVDAIIARLAQDGARCVRYDGAVKDDARAEAVERFQRGDAQVFVGNAQCAGEGLTLHAASTVIYYNNTFKLTERLQSEDRAHRIGQTKPVLYVDLVVADTVDEHVAKALVNKQDVAGVITGDQLRAWL